ncbi:MAG: glycosyltransferase, partial [Firmicutes bacterium]|nr:glycosyltransferase [Candidatus Colimorpha enterica]
MKKQIAIVQPSLCLGGVEKVLVNLLRSFDYSKYDIDLYITDRNGFFTDKLPPQVRLFDSSSESSEKKILLNDLKSFKIFDALKSVYYRILLELSNNDRKKHLYSYSKWVDLLSDKEYDSVISFHGCTYVNNLITLFRLKGKQKIAWVHGDTPDLCDDDIYSRFDKVFCVSKGAEDLFLKKCPSCIGKTHVVYNIIDTADIKKKSEEQADDFDYFSFSIVSVGRISSEKGFSLVPEIAKRLNDDGYSYKWYIVGDGLEKDVIAYECCEKNLSNVIFLGAKKNPYPYMANCNIYVQPSFTEGFCTTTNEAK